MKSRRQLRELVLRYPCDAIFFVPFLSVKFQNVWPFEYPELRSLCWQCWHVVLFSSVKGMHRFLYKDIHTVIYTLKMNISINKFYKCNSCCEVVIGAHAGGQQHSTRCVLDVRGCTSWPFSEFHFHSFNFYNRPRHWSLLAWFILVI